MPSTEQHHRGVFAPSLESATVADAMHQGIVSCPPEASPAKVARLMATHGVHCVFVMHPGYDDSDDPYLWGMISDLDLMRAALHRDDPKTAGALARQPMVSVKQTMRLTDACELMVRHSVSHVVVLDRVEPRPVGVLSTTDVADIFAWGEN